MTRKTHRVGAIASAATFVALYFSTAISGAVAQDQAEPSALDTVTQEAPTLDSEAEPQVRFVSNAVVQEIPQVEETATIAPAMQAGSLRTLVNTLPAGGAMSDEMQCLAQAVYFESRGEPLDGQLAVARVVINRAASHRFPDDYCSVVTQRAQFSFVRGGHIPAPNTSSNAWQRAKAIARIAHQDLWDSEAGESLYFHASSVSPRWARSKASVARIDSHIFYR